MIRSIVSLVIIWLLALTANAGNPIRISTEKMDLIPQFGIR